MRAIAAHRVRLLLVTVFLTVGARDATASAKPGAREVAAAQSFWAAFRTAVQKKDTAAVMRFANFPFIIRFGNDDPNDPTRPLDRQEMTDTLDRFLAMHDESIPDAPTMSEIVENTVTVPAHGVAVGEFDVGDFEFQKVKGTWRWIAVLTADPSFYPSPDSSEVPKASPIRKLLIDETARALKLRRPLTVKHLRTTSDVTYIEVREPGKDGRYARALLERQPDDAAGKTSWLVKQWSVLSVNGDDAEWRDKMAALRKSGAPVSLFPAEVVREENDGHAPPR
jgi:hypothetical protein